MRELRAIAILVLISACLLMGVPLLNVPLTPSPDPAVDHVWYLRRRVSRRARLLRRRFGCLEVGQRAESGG